MSTDTDSETKVTMICPNLTCRRTLSAPISARGKIMRCMYCNTPFRVPDKATLDSEAPVQSGPQRKA